MFDGHPGPVRFNNKSRDFPITLMAGHDDDDVCDCSIRAPQFFSVEHIRISILRFPDRGFNAGRIRADFRFCQRKRRDRSPGDPRKILLLLCPGSE